MPLLVRESPLQLFPSLAKKVGMNEAIVLAQIHYWLDPVRNQNVFEGKHWVHNTYEQWQKQFSFWSTRTIRRIFGALETQNILETFSQNDDPQKGKFYTISCKTTLSLLQKKERPLQLFPSLAKELGLGGAVVLSQVHYWLNLKRNKNVFEGKRWVYNTYEQWHQQFAFWSVPTIRRIFGALEAENILSVFSEKDDPQKGKSYSINYERLKNRSKSVDFLHGQSDHHPLANLSTAPDQHVHHQGNCEFEGGGQNDQDGQNDQGAVANLITPYILITETTDREEREGKKKEKNKKKEKTEIFSEKRALEEGANLLQAMVDVWNEQIQIPLYEKNTHAAPQKPSSLISSLPHSWSEHSSSESEALSTSYNTNGFLIKSDSNTSHDQNDYLQGSREFGGDSQNDHHPLDNLITSSDQNGHPPKTCEFEEGVYGQNQQNEVANTDALGDETNWPYAQVGQGDPHDLAASYIQRIQTEKEREEEKNKKKETAEIFSGKKACVKEVKFADGNLPQAMVEFWNEHIQIPLYGKEALIRLTTTRIAKLALLLEEALDNSPTAWEAYCQKIVHNRFLMGENKTGLRVTFDWAIQVPNARKILEGAIYDKCAASRTHSSTFPASDSWSKSDGLFSHYLNGILIERSLDQYVEFLRQHCTNNGYPDAWFEICKHLTSEVGQAVFKNWFKDMIPLELTVEKARLAVKSSFFRDYIYENFFLPLEKVVRAVFSKDTRVHIRVGM